MLDSNTAALRIHEQRDYAGGLDFSALWEQAQEQAYNEFTDGNLDDLIRELVIDEPADAVALALHATFPAYRRENGFAVRDFTATVNKVIEDRTQELFEEMKEDLL